nr:unnamed protein product [Digitaria exilis]
MAAVTSRCLRLRLALSAAHGHPFLTRPSCGSRRSWRWMSTLPTGVIAAMPLGRALNGLTHHPRLGSLRWVDLAPDDVRIGDAWDAPGRVQICGCRRRIRSLTEVLFICGRGAGGGGVWAGEEALPCWEGAWRRSPTGSTLEDALGGRGRGEGAIAP